MNTETTGKDAIAKVNGRVFYDAECRFCVAGMKRWGGLFARRGFEWLPLQTPGTAARLGVSEEQLMEEMWLQLTDGRVVSGVNSWAHLMRNVWWMWPLGVLLGVPGINAIARGVYRWVARNRHCLGGSCKIHSHRRAGVHATDVLLVGLVVAAVCFVGRGWPAWVFMWGILLTLGLLGKWLAWRDAQTFAERGCVVLDKPQQHRNAGPTPRIQPDPAFGAAAAGLRDTAALRRLKTLGWFLLWPGLDGRAFFGAERAPAPPMREWFTALFKLALGIALIWFVGPRWFGDQPLTLGWCGMVGIVLVLHFGIFHLLSLAWRSCGVNAAPIMNRPLAATSLAHLWGECWNTAFSIPSRRMVFQPLARRLGPGAASFVVFAASGVLHDLVISIPARGGYGLPTAYFLLQGAGVWFERSRLGRALGLGAGGRGWMFTLVLAAGPAFWLFHPPAVRNVILPMLQAIGAT